MILSIIPAIISSNFLLIKPIVCALTILDSRVGGHLFRTYYFTFIVNLLILMEQYKKGVLMMTNEKNLISSDDVIPDWATSIDIDGLNDFLNDNPIFQKTKHHTYTQTEMDNKHKLLVSAYWKFLLDKKDHTKQI